MLLSKANQKKLDDVDFEYRAMLIEICNFELGSSKDCHARYFAQFGALLAKVKGLPFAIQNKMLRLTKDFSFAGFFEFGKILVGVNPRGILTMQQILSLESELYANLNDKGDYSHVY